MIQLRLVLLGLAVIGGIGLAVYNHYKQQEEPQAHQYGSRRRRRSPGNNVSCSRNPNSISASRRSVNDDCTICLSRIGKGPARSLRCGHVFHDLCIEVWNTDNKTCPNCRAAVL